MSKSKFKSSKGTSDYPNSKFETKFDERNRRFMICENSVPDGKHWKGRLCGNWSEVGHRVVSVLCSDCVQKVVDPPVIKVALPKSDKPKGWKLMKEFVASDGTVYFKGIEQPELKGTRDATIITEKEPKKKMSKQEKEELLHSLGEEIRECKALLVVETRKGKKSEIARRLSKANRALNKLIK